MTRICKSNHCNNEIPDDWKSPYCDACRYRTGKKAREVFAAAGGAGALGSVVFLLAKTGRLSKVIKAIARI